MPYSRENRYMLLNDRDFLMVAISDLMLIHSEYVARSSLGLPYLRFNRQRVRESLQISINVLRSVWDIAESVEESR